MPIVARSSVVPLRSLGWRYGLRAGVAEHGGLLADFGIVVPEEKVAALGLALLAGVKPPSVILPTILRLQVDSWQPGLAVAVP